VLSQNRHAPENCAMLRTAQLSQNPKLTIPDLIFTLSFTTTHTHSEMTPAGSTIRDKK